MLIGGVFHQADCSKNGEFHSKMNCSIPWSEQKQLKVSATCPGGVWKTEESNPTAGWRCQSRSYRGSI